MDLYAQINQVSLQSFSESGHLEVPSRMLDQKKLAYMRPI